MDEFLIVLSVGHLMGHLGVLKVLSERMGVIRMVLYWLIDEFDDIAGDNNVVDKDDDDNNHVADYVTMWIKYSCPI